MPADKKISVLGLKGAGKTTFLGVLPFALAQRKSLWRIMPENHTTLASLYEIERHLFSDGLFPFATAEQSELVFKVQKEPSMMGIQPGAEFILFTADIPGEAAKGSASESLIYHDFYTSSIKNCAGMIFLIDPEESWHYGGQDKENSGDAYFSLFSSILSEIKSNSPNIFIAFCITKLDSLYSANSEFALRGIVSDIDKVAKNIVGANTKAIIDYSFDPDHVAWFPISSVGYVGHGEERVSQRIINNSDNIRGYQIREPRSLQPIGVAEAFEWLLNSIARRNDNLANQGSFVKSISKGLHKLFGG